MSEIDRVGGTLPPSLPILSILKKVELQMQALTHFDHINNNVDLSQIKLKDPIPVMEFYNTNTPQGGFIFRSKMHHSAMLSVCPNKLIYMQEYRVYHTVANHCKFNYVYVIEGTHKGVSKYKIGKANDINDRLSRFDVKIPFDISLIMSFRVRDALDFEKELHRTFSDKRLSGEWFDLDSKDFGEIIKYGIQRESRDYLKALDEIIDEHKKNTKKEKWQSDLKYIKYLESILVFNQIQFEGRD